MAVWHSVVRCEVESGPSRGLYSALNSDSDNSSGGESSGDEGLDYVSDASWCSDDEDTDYEGSDSDDGLSGETLVVDFAKYRRQGGYSI